MTEKCDPPAEQRLRTAGSSFRDPAGVVLPFAGRILRLITDAGKEDVNAFLKSKTGEKYTATGQVVKTALLSDTQRSQLLSDSHVRAVYGEINASEILEHERIPFPSFPYEWAPEMLEAAGQLTLDLARECLTEDLGLKDATPLNVLFKGTEPVFVDVLSFERRNPQDPTWLPYAQCVRTFLLPLLASKHFGVPLGQVLLSRRDGLEPEDLYRWLGLLDRIKPRFLTHVSIPVWLASRHDRQDTTIYRPKTIADPEKARFIVDSLLCRLKRALSSAAPAAEQKSVWSDYMSGNNNYSQQQFQAKQRFVSEALRDFAAQSVLDVGCNTGVFSSLAARTGASVVAIDYDATVVGRVWRSARAERLDILPLVVDLTRPTPSVGWMNREWPSFLDRAAGRFDTVMMLAVVHHMLVTERVPLPDIMTMAAQLTTDKLMLEFIEPEDSMFRELLRGREHLHKNVTTEYFERICSAEFDIIRSARLPDSHRCMYLLQKRG